MPRSSVVLSAQPIDADTVARAAAAVAAAAGDDAPELELRAVDDGAVLQVIAGGAVVLSVLRPRLIPGPGELARILPGVAAPPGARWWAEAYTPWRREGAVGLAILDTAASGGRAVHQDTAHSARR